MRLIDADALKKDLKSVTLSNGTLVNTNAVLYLLEEYQTAYDVDKVVEQLEEYREEMEQFKCGGMLSDMIEVVKAGGVDAKTDS